MKVKFTGWALNRHPLRLAPTAAASPKRTFVVQAMGPQRGQGRQKTASLSDTSPTMRISVWLREIVAGLY